MSLSGLLTKPPKALGPAKRRGGGNPETALQRSILEALALVYRGRAIFWRCNSGVIRVERRLIKLAPSGTADILGVIAPRGFFIGLEVKCPGKNLTPDQVSWHEKIRTLGGWTARVRSIPEALDAVDAALKSIGEVPPPRPWGLQ